MERYTTRHAFVADFRHILPEEQWRAVNERAHLLDQAHQRAVAARSSGGNGDVPAE